MEQFIEKALEDNEKLKTSYKSILKIGKDFEGKYNSRFTLNPY